MPTHCRRRRRSKSPSYRRRRRSPCYRRRRRSPCRARSRSPTTRQLFTFSKWAEVSQQFSHLPPPLAKVMTRSAIREQWRQSPLGRNSYYGGCPSMMNY